MGESRELIEGADYYLEDGRWVFTAKFLRDRGYCCGSGCRHCPYQIVDRRASEDGQGSADDQHPR